jgi:hypothetical protein
MGNNTRCGVLDHILGLRKDQPAREPKGKTLPGWALWCSGARTVPALGPLARERPRGYPGTRHTVTWLIGVRTVGERR